MAMAFRSKVLVLALCAWGSTVLGAPQPPVQGREYKLMLDPGRFAGDDEVVQSRVESYWTELKALIQAAPLSRKVSGELKYDKQRTIMFHDVPAGCNLKNSGYILRERVEPDGKRELTLKYRSADRYISSTKQVAGKQKDAETKFEDDIIAPFKSVFSKSSKQTISTGKNINRVKDVLELYPGLADENLSEKLPLTKVGGLTIHEKTYKNAEIDLGNKRGKFALTLWYTEPGAGKPVLAEISFSYGDLDEQYTSTVATNAKLLLDKMQDMPAWPQTNSLTKTAWVYAHQPGFCQ